MEKENAENFKGASKANKIVPMSNQLPYDPRRRSLYYVNDEVSLVDLWIILTNAKRVFWLVLALFLIAGINASVLIPEKYRYKTTVEIGSRISDGVSQPIESPETLLAKIQESYIPLVQNQYSIGNPATQIEFEIKARIPQGSQIIVLESKGPKDTGEIYKELQQRVVQEVKNDHKRTLNIIRKDLESSLNVATNRLDELKDEAVLLTSRESRLEGMKMLLSRQIEEAKKDLFASQKNRHQAVKEASNATKAMTLLMLDNEIYAQRKRVATLEERLLVEMADSHDDYAKKIADNLRLQSNQQDVIAHLESQLVNLVETRALAPPMQSIKPTGPGALVIIAIMILLGIIVATISVFVLEFIRRANKQMQESSDSAETEKSSY